MTFSPNEKALAVALLRRAKKSYSAASKPSLMQGLCFHIHRSRKIDVDELVCNKLLDLVHSRLDGHIYYPSWVRLNYPELCGSIMDQRKKARAGRLAWFDALIKEFSE